MKIFLETIENLARQAFPRATLVSHHLLAKDSGNLDYLLQLQEPAVKIILRIYPDVMSELDIEKEIYVLRVVMPETGVPTRRVIHFDDSRTVADWPFALLNFLPGEPLKKALSRMDEMDQESAGYEMGRYLAKLHTIPLDKFGEFLGNDPESSASEKAYTLTRFTDWLGFCEEKSLLNSSAIAELYRLAGQTRALDRDKACFVHGNYHGGNISLEEGFGGFHVTGVFNFGHARGWSPEWDMACLAVHDLDDYPSCMKGFLDGYVDAARFPENFWERFVLYQLVANVRFTLDAYGQDDESLLNLYRARLYRSLENRLDKSVG